ncbi:hypothetical protein ACLOJK_014866, partial [Asimina triloba]
MHLFIENLIGHCSSGHYSFCGCLQCKTAVVDGVANVDDVLETAFSWCMHVGGWHGRAVHGGETSGRSGRGSDADAFGKNEREEDLPRVAFVINVGLRPRQIWNELAVAVMMNGSDWSDGGPSMLAFDGDVAASWSSSSVGVAMGGTAGGGRGERRHRAVTGSGGVLAGGGSGGSHGCRPSLEHGGALK